MRQHEQMPELIGRRHVQLLSRNPADEYLTQVIVVEITTNRNTLVTARRAARVDPIRGFDASRTVDEEG